jgi:hypothetical protein
MFNSMNRTTTTKTPRSSIALAVLATSLAALTACGRSGSTTAGGAPVAPTTQVVITGAIQKTYTPEGITAVKIDRYVGINVNEQFPCGVTLQFPIDIQPGAYPIGDRLHQPVTDIFAEYGVSCNRAGIYVGSFQSTKGTLTLTASGARYSGKFEFTAREVIDESKTIQVSGSFNDVSRP